MKLLKNLKVLYAEDDISTLVDVVDKLPLYLEEDREYVCEKAGNVVNVYGRTEGIGTDEYMIGNVGDMPLLGVTPSKTGVEIQVGYVGVEKVVLHYSPHDKPAPKPKAPRKRRRQPSGESRRRSSPSRGESRRRTSGGESRRRASYGESRGGGGESLNMITGGER